MQPIFIGDVQGCSDELDELLSRADRQFGRNYQANFVGDLVNRGPDNLRVLNVVRELWEQGRGLCVLGNHELHLLARYWGLRAEGAGDTIQDVLTNSEAEGWVNWLRRLPVACTGNFRTKEWVLVHAAVGPEWGIAEIKARAGAVSSRLGSNKVEEARTFLGSDAKEDPVRDDLAFFTSCRSLVAETVGARWTRSEPDLFGGVPWHEAWRDGGHDYGVIYGHWAAQGLHSAVNLRGLDTGCVYHGRWAVGKLTAWLPNMGLKDPFSVPDGRFWHAVARRVYYREDK